MGMLVVNGLKMVHNKFLTLRYWDGNVNGGIPLAAHTTRQKRNTSENIEKMSSNYSGI